MKKLLSLGLAAMLAFGLATTSFAAETDDAAVEPTVTIKKTYQVANAGTTAPAETFRFTVVPGGVTNAADGVTGENMPMIGTKNTDTDATGNPVYTYTAEVAFGDITEETTIPFNVYLPNCDKSATVGTDGRYAAYPSVGVYTYYLTEDDNGTAGVIYDVNKPTTAGVDQRIKVVVTVEQDTTGLIRVVGVHAERPYADTKKDKVDTVVNKYEAASAVKVEKLVEGNLGDQSKKFNMTVTFTSDKKVNSTITYGDQTIAPDDWTQSEENGPYTVTKTISLAHGEMATFVNVPYGVTYVVNEAAYDGYTATYSNAKTEDGVTTIVPVEVDNDNELITVTNTKEGEIDNGVVLNNMPYVLVLAVLAAGVAVFIIRKRRED